MFRICKIITETVEGANSLKEFLGGYPVEITSSYPDEGYFEVPTLIIGWNSVKSRFTSQKIQDKNVTTNLQWTYSESECKEIKKENFHNNIEYFVNENLKKWLPSDFFLYDSLMHGDFSKFIEKNIDSTKLTYIHFNSGAIYMRNDNKNFIVNTKSLWFTESDYRSVITGVFNKMNCMVYSYDGIEDYTNLDSLGNIQALDIIRWIKHGVETPIKYFQIIPGVDISKYVPFLMSKIPLDTLSLDEEEEVYFERMCVRDKAARWMSTRYISFSHEFKKNLDFVYRDNAKLARVNYSTKKTLTGRIPCSDKYNPQNLSKSNEDRTMIISRFRNGKIYQFDYTSFEARIALYICGDEDFIQDFYDKDLHSETARIIFDTHEFSAEQREIAKLANMAIMYGASEATALKILEKYPEPQEKLRRIKSFLRPIFNKAAEVVEEAKLNGYLINKWGSIIRPEKDFAGFNNYLQSTAAEIIVDKVLEIKILLVGYRSQFMFQVHDSLIFDIHPEEEHLVEKIAKILSYNRGMLFSVNYKSGSNYRDLSSESVYF